jgi:hypothetical protein
MPIWLEIEESIVKNAVPSAGIFFYIKRDIRKWHTNTQSRSKSNTLKNNTILIYWMLICYSQNYNNS